MSILVSNLTKYFGNQKALDGLNFEVKKGEIVGFLGPNGAGKSTTMKIIAGYIQASTGEVTIMGKNFRNDEDFIKRNIGYLPENNPLYLDMYIVDFLRFIGNLNGIKTVDLKAKVTEIIELVGLTAEVHKKIGQLSKGYRQRVGLAQALIHNPEVLILDEPTTGLDPNQINEIRNVIKNTSKNKAVLFSTHIMQEVEAICDRVIMIHKGKIVAQGTLAEIKAMGSSLEEVFRSLTI